MPPSLSIIIIPVLILCLSTCHQQINRCHGATIFTSLAICIFSHYYFTSELSCIVYIPWICNYYPSHLPSRLVRGVWATGIGFKILEWITKILEFLVPNKLGGFGGFPNLIHVHDSKINILLFLHPFSRVILSPSIFSSLGPSQLSTMSMTHLSSSFSLFSSYLNGDPSIFPSLFP